MTEFWAVFIVFVIVSSIEEMVYFVINKIMDKRNKNYNDRLVLRVTIFVLTLALVGLAGQAAR